MAAQTTALTEFSDTGNSRTYALADHTFGKPRLVLQKRKVAAGQSTVAEDRIMILSGTVDADGAAIPERVSFEVVVRRPVHGASSDVIAMLAVLRDIVAGDEFANTVDTQEYLV